MKVSSSNSSPSFSNDDAKIGTVTQTPLFSPLHPLRRRSPIRTRRRTRPRRHRIRTHGRQIRPLGTRRNNSIRIVKINIQQTARTTKLLLVPRAQHIALGQILLHGGTRQGSTAVAFLAELDTGVGLGCFLGGAEGDARFDAHAGFVGVVGAGEEAPGDFLVAAFGDVGADALDRCRRYVGGEIVHAEAGGATTDLRRVSGASHVTAREADLGELLQGVAAIALLAEFETREAVVVGAAAAEGLAGFNGHGCGVGVGSLVESAGIGFVGTAEINPAVVDGLTGGGAEGCRSGRCDW